MSAFEFTGGSLRGGPRNEVPEMDEYDRKEYLRKNRRRPMAETISEIGEGRGTDTSITPHPNSTAQFNSTHAHVEMRLL